MREVCKDRGWNARDDVDGGPGSRECAAESDGQHHHEVRQWFAIICFFVVSRVLFRERVPGHAARFSRPGER